MKAGLFNKEHIEEIEKRYLKWLESVREGGGEGGADGSTHSAIPVKLLHTPLDIAGQDYLEDVGFSGQPPFVRGVYPDMYRGKPFTVRQLSGLGAPEDCNLRVKYLLSHGATGVNVLFDLPTIRGYDSDDPEAEGNVGHCGAAVDSLWDIEAYFADIPIERISTSIVSHLPSTSLVIPGMFFVMAQQRGIPLSSLAGTCQNDFLMETVIGSAPQVLPPSVSFRMQCDVVEWISIHLPRWNPISFNGYNLREAGTDAVTEVAVAIANALATAEELVRRGMDVDRFAPRFSFFWDLHNDFFEEIAKCRASRKVWYRMMKERFDPKDERSLRMRFHVQTSGISLAAVEPYNNIVRSTLQALAAVMGGAQSLHVDSFDEAYSAPTPQAALLSIRTQQIIQKETGVVRTVDPLAGSYYLEYLTEQMCQRITAYVEKIEEMGGLVALCEKGWLHRQISSYQRDYQKKIESGEIPFVAVNCFKGESEPQQIEVFEYPEAAQRQKEKLKRLRQVRDKGRLEESLQQLRNKCHGWENLFPYVLDAVRALATLGEIGEVFREEFGLWEPPPFF